MTIFGNSLLNEKAIEEMDSQAVSLETKLAYWVKELYRFSDRELKNHFGKRSADLINRKLIQKSYLMD
jgi:hypothetical protein